MILFAGYQSEFTCRQGAQYATLPRCSLFIFFALSISVGFAQSGIITTYVGPSLPVNGALATTQAVDFPGAVAPDGAGGFYVSSQYQNRVYRVDAGGKINLIAGNGVMGYSGDGRTATSAQLNAPWGIAVDSAGNLYIADTNNNRVRKVTTDGVIHTIAGNGSAGYSGDGKRLHRLLCIIQQVWQSIPPAGRTIYRFNSFRFLSIMDMRCWTQADERNGSLGVFWQ
jgi:hypothetical protein